MHLRIKQKKCWLVGKVIAKHNCFVANESRAIPPLPEIWKENSGRCDCLEEQTTLIRRQIVDSKI